MQQQEQTKSRWAGLQFRMMISYALTTRALVLAGELVLGSILAFALTYGPFAETASVGHAKQAAKLYAFAAAALASGQALDPQTTFQPDRPASLALSRDILSNGNDLPYQASAPAGSSSPFGVLVAPDGHIVTSTNPAEYPPAAPFAQSSSAQYSLVRQALGGEEGSGVVSSQQGRAAVVAEPVVSKGKVIGALYVQTPEISSANVAQGLGGGLLFSLLIGLVLMLPVGAVFSLITTRGLVRRIHRLAAATTRFADGDYAQRVPISGRDEVWQLEQHFNGMATELVESMAAREALAQKSARLEERARIEQEMRTARSIQQALLPKEVPTPTGWKLTPYYQPAVEVGGDFYDFLSFDDGSLGIVIGDVTGKGIPAALVMAITRTMLRTAAQTVSAPGEVLAHVNELLCGDIPAGMFVTCFSALLNPATGELRYANVGHDLPYVRAGQTVSELYATGMPLGLMPGMCYEERITTQAPNSTALFYSDGLVEAHNGSREMFGFPRLKKLLGASRENDQLVATLLGELARFTGAGWAQEDDITLLTVRRMPKA